ncbi:MAG: nitrilase-related carbon-nitrogen hydrolase [Prochlorococcaceae cyanobacterium]
MAENRRFWVMAALGGGVLAGVALPPLALAPLLWLALVPLWSLAQRPRAGAAPLLAGLWGLAAVLVGHRWLLWLHPLDWVGVPGPLSLPLCLLIWLLCGLAGALLVAAWAVLVRRLDGRRLSTALLAALVWGLVEVALARGPLFWIGLGAAALPLDPPLAGLGAIGGSGLVAAAQLLMAWALWRLLLPGPQRRRRLLLITLLLLGLHGAGAWALAANGAPPLPPLQPVPQRWLVLQPAIPTREKFEPLQQGRLLRLLQGAQREAAGAAADGLLLPEGALALGQQLPEPAALEVLSGGFRLVGNQQRSSLLRFPLGGRQPLPGIDKHRLVPLGEWVPGAGMLSWAGLSAVGGLSPGVPSRLLARPQGSIAVAICYELSDGAALARAVRQGAGWLVATANLDPYPSQLRGQFQALARQRAIETGRWLVSAANTGPSLVVDAQGRLRQQLPAAVATTGLMEVLPLARLTPYDRWGERPLLLLLLALGIGRWLGFWIGRSATTTGVATGVGPGVATAESGGAPAGPPAPPRG